MLQEIIERWKRNWRGFWGRYWWLILVFVAALGCDAASTIYFMMRDGGHENEVHPAIWLSSAVFGPVLGPLLGWAGKAAAGIAVAVYWRRIAVYLFGVASILSFWAAWYNIWGVNIYIPRIFRWCMG
jgi:hypothetical protein